MVVEGEAERVTDPAKLHRVADAYASKYNGPFRFIVRDGILRNGEGAEALLYEVAPTKALGFGKGDSFSETRWRF